MTSFTYTGNNGFAPRIAAVMKFAEENPEERTRAKAMLDRILIKMVDAEDQLTKFEVREAITVLRDFMIADSESFDAVTVGTSGGSITGVGSGLVLAGTVNKFGETLQSSYAEDLVCTCIRDQQQIGRANFEVFEVRGEQWLPNMDRDWPGGSGAVKRYTAVSPASGANLLANSDFENFTTNDPDDWTIGVGSAGTNVRETSTSYTKSKALDFDGDGSTLVSIYQSFGRDRNNRFLKPQTVYCISIWGRTSSGTPAAGAIQIQIEETSSGDELATAGSGGSASTLTIDVTAENATYSNHNVFFATPENMVLSNGYRIQIEQTTAITSGTDYYMDNMVLTEAPEAYPGGPPIAVVAGATPFAVDDEAIIAVTNNGSATDFMYLIRRYWLDPRSYDVVLPNDTGGSETIADSILAAG